MKIFYTESFIDRLENQITYISKDNPAAAKRFKKDLIERIKKIPQNHLIYRRSIYFSDDNIRDLIFKGYVVVFRVNTLFNQIEIFGLVKFRELP